MTNLPHDGARIVFDVVPFGSYAKPATAYLVGRSGNTIHLTNVATGSGTFDPAWRYRSAAWRLA